MLVSVLIPTRLSMTPSQDGLLVERAIHSVAAQSLVASGKASYQIILGLDNGTAIPKAIREFPSVEAAVSSGRSQATAVNAAAAHIKGDYVAILEDDDQWHPQFLEIASANLSSTPFVSSNQLEIDSEGRTVRIVDYPTPSGWLMTRATWNAVGNFNEMYDWWLDSEWIGRLNEQKIPRTHLIEASAPSLESLSPITFADRLLRRAKEKKRRQGLLTLSKVTNLQLRRHEIDRPLVIRMTHQAQAHKLLKLDSTKPKLEADRIRLETRYGHRPW